MGNVQEAAVGFALIALFVRFMTAHKMQCSRFKVPWLPGCVRVKLRTPETEKRTAALNMIRESH